MKKSTKYGIIGSVLSCIIVFLLLWFLVFPTLDSAQKEDEGLVVSFGDNLDGSGKTDKPVEIPVEKPTQVATPIETTKPTKQDFVTQTDKSLEIAEQKRKETERKESVALEKQRIDAERRANEKKQKEQVAIDKANAMNGMFGNNNSNGSGTGSGDTRQGNPAGKGSSGGNSWSLNGRYLNGKLVSPSYDKDVEGKITVNIRVDEKGIVTTANVGTPTTISDLEMRNAAITAAKNTHFTEGKGVSTGTISYTFNLK